MCVCWVMPRMGAASFLGRKCGQRTEAHRLVEKDRRQDDVEWTISEGHFRLFQEAITGLRGNCSGACGANWSRHLEEHGLRAAACRTC